MESDRDNPRLGALSHFMVKYLILILLPIGLACPQTYRLKPIYLRQPIGGTLSPVLCFDSNRNGQHDLTEGAVFAGWRIWENAGDSFRLTYTNPIQYGTWDIGDVDQDGLIDRLQTGNEDLGGNTKVLTFESADSWSYPVRRNWLLETNSNEPRTWYAYYPGDLDGSGRRAIVYNQSDIGVVHILKNVGDNDNREVWNSEGQVLSFGGAIAFGDFDEDGRKDFALSGGSWQNWVAVFENTGVNQYQRVFRDTITLPNGHFDAFAGRNVKGDGRPAFFINFMVSYGGQTWRFHLYMWQATGDNRYARVCIDSTAGGQWWGGAFLRSLCCDLDGDGVEEIVRTCGNTVYIYKYLNGQFHRMVWYQIVAYNTSASAADINHDGYPELVISSGDPEPRTDILELEAVRLLTPNGGETWPAGSRQRIRWTVYPYPRCDSLSLLYSTDNGRSYAPIVSGIPPGDTSFPWTVPDVQSDSCRVRIKTFGPGQKRDESDGRFRIISAAIGEETTGVVLRTKLIDAVPNPCAGQTRIWFQLREPSEVSLRICDVAGRTVATLADGVMKPGRYSLDWNRAATVPVGIYFIDFRTPQIRETRKLAVVR